MKVTIRRCKICKEPFQPHPRNNRVWGQKTCDKPECRRAWKRRRWRYWAKLHPERLKSESRRAKVRAWAKAYPDYHRHYRATHPDYVKRDNRRRVAARKSAKLSAKQTIMGRNLVEKFRALDGLKPAKVSAKQTPILRRVDALEDCLRSTVATLWSAKQNPIALPAPSAG